MKSYSLYCDNCGASLNSDNGRYSVINIFCWHCGIDLRSKYNKLINKLLKRWLNGFIFMYVFMAVSNTGSVENYDIFISNAWWLTFKERKKMESLQLKTIAKDSANVIQSAIAWDEPLSGDDIEILVNTFKLTLQDLNGDDDNGKESI